MNLLLSTGLLKADKHQDVRSMKNPFGSLRFPEFKKSRPTASKEDGQISLSLYADPNQCELFPDDLEAWIRWIEQLDLTCLGRRPVQESGRKVLLELCYRVGWNPDTNADRYGEAWPSVESIAQNAFPNNKSARRKTIRILRRLEEAGHIECIERRRTDGGTSTNLYRLEPAMRKKAEATAQNGGVSKTAVIDTGGVSKTAVIDTGGVSKTAVIDTLTKIEQKDELQPAHERGDFVEKAVSAKSKKQRARAWLRTKNVLALKYASIAVSDPEHWRRVQSAAKAHPEAGPGLIVGWLKDPETIPDVTFTQLQTCPHRISSPSGMYVDGAGVRRCRYCSECQRESEIAPVSR